MLDDGREVNRLGLGASLGRGFESRLGDGWMVFDLRTSLAEGAATRTNLGAVVGVKPHRRLSLELGAFVEHATDTSWQVGPVVQLNTGALGELRLGLFQSSDDGTMLFTGFSRSF